LPDTHEGEKPQVGIVLAAGESLLHESGKMVEVPCKIGQKVVYKKWGGNEFKQEDGKELIFVKFDDILAIVE
jgi:chaperonin GroES